MRGRNLLLALPLLMGPVLQPASAAVGVSVGVSVPGVQIGINVPAYPELQPVPEYPVYYAPGLPANYFFYDGLYWVYANDYWYSSSWYNGPWYVVEPAVVPVFVLRVPVRYYRAPPPYFHGWAVAEPPRWGAHWGPRWEEQHRGWSHWDRRQAPAPAPLPVYQRQYVGDRYPTHEQQHVIREQQYHFEPRDARVRERLAAEARHDAERDPRDGATPRPQAAPQQPTARAKENEQATRAQQRQQREARERDAQQQHARRQEDSARQQQQQQARQQQQRDQQAQERQARENEQQTQSARQQQQQQARQAQQQREQQAHDQQARQQQQMQERQQQQARQQQELQDAERHAAERARAQRPPRQPERGESPREGRNGG